MEKPRREKYKGQDSPKKPNSPPSLEKWAYLQLLKHRMQEEPTLTISAFQKELRDSYKEMLVELRKCRAIKRGF